jgi:glycosyltransferase involved in cell wall biosynthesis
VVPSLWPEPFGLVGLEAARLSVPAVAFDVGGVTEWLKDGVNGFLAPGDPPTAQGLAGAIARCFSAPGQMATLRAGARAVAGANADFAAHLEVLLQLLESTAGSRVVC